jgi:hypothetical protein
VLSLHTAWGLVSSRTGSPICGGACLPSSWAEQARRCEADRGRQVPYRCLDRLADPRNRTAATKTPALFAAAFLRSLHLPTDLLECLSKERFAHVVSGRACRALAVLKTMTGDYASSGTGAQEFDASFRARDGAFLTVASIPQTIPNRAIVSRILPAARVLRLLRPVEGEMF